MDFRRGGWPGPGPPTGNFTINRASPQAAGLVLWMPLFGPDANVDRYVDRVAGWSFTKNGTPVWMADSMFGNSLTFDDGSSEYLGITSAPLSSEPITMSCWFRSDNATALQTLISISRSDTWHTQWRLCACGSVADDPVGMHSRDAVASAWAYSTTGYSANTWHHAAGVCASDTDRRAMIDGGSKSSDGDNIAVSNTVDRTTVGYMVYGGSPAFGDYFSGSIADVRIYNRALSDAEVWALYDPATRWELYQPVVPIFVVATVGAVTHEATATDRITMAETRSVLATFQATASDGANLGESRSALATLLAASVDGVVLTEALSTLATYLATGTDAMEFSDVSGVIAQLLTSATDGVDLGDVSGAVSQLLASATDGVTLSDAILAELLFSVVSLDGITIGDSGSTLATFSATASDGVTLTEVLTAVTTFVAIASDAFNMSDISVSVSVVSGMVTVTFTSKSGSIVFIVKVPEVEFTDKAPDIAFS